MNYEALLDLSPELVDLWFIYQQFSNKWNSKYKFKESPDFDITENDVQIDNLNLIWNLSTSRFVSFKFKGIKSERA